MRPGALFLFGCLALGCRTTRAPAPDPLLAQCQADPNSDARCVEALTGGQQEYESREQVMQAEAEKEADAFHNRLARLRAQAEAKAIATRTASVAEVEPEPPTDPEAEAALDALAQGPGEPIMDSGSSVRAIAAAPRPVAPLVIPPIVPSRSIPKGVEGPAQPAAGLKGMPTPEEYLRSGRCLIETDLPALKATIAEGQKQKASRQTLGAAALVVLDAEGLRDAVSAELQHRGLVKGRPLCTDSQLEGVAALLRTLIGDAPKAVGGLDGYGRGLGRLRAELEVRAGLPRRE